MDLIKDVLPAGVVHIVTGFGPEAGKPLASSPRVAKVAFTGETTHRAPYYAICIRKPEPGYNGTWWQIAKHIYAKRNGCR